MVDTQDSLIVINDNVLFDEVDDEVLLEGSAQDSFVIIVDRDS